MFAANLDKSSQVSFDRAKLTNRSLSSLTVSYSVRKSVRRIAFLTSFGKRKYAGTRPIGGQGFVCSEQVEAAPISPSAV
jgi:hypothetical protein